MKKTHIAAIVVVIIALGVIFTTLNDSGSFADFNKAKAQTNETFQVVGVLNKEKPIIYNPHKNTDLFTFFMTDKSGTESKVYCKGTIPQDFKRADQIVLTGEYKDGAFYASKMLMKCPSKYNNGTPDDNKTTTTVTYKSQI